MYVRARFKEVDMCVWDVRVMTPKLFSLFKGTFHHFAFLLLLPSLILISTFYFYFFILYIYFVATLTMGFLSFGTYAFLALD